MGPICPCLLGLELDQLHPRVLKELATELGPMFAHLQHSIDTDEIPKGMVT